MKNKKKENKNPNKSLNEKDKVVSPNTEGQNLKGLNSQEQSQFQ